MNVSSIQTPYFFQSKRTGKTATASPNSFSEAFEAEKVKAETAEPVQKSSEPSYAVTEEEAEYFREKYGEEYDGERAEELLFELSGSNIISSGDVRDTLGYSVFQRAEGPLICMDGNGSFLGFNMLQSPDGRTVCVDNTYAYLEELIRQGKAELPRVRPNYQKSYLNGVYSEFEQRYGKTVNTWQDYMQKQLDFYTYVIGSDEIPEGGNGRYAGTDDKRELNVYLEKSRGRIQKAADVISQIFG